MSSYIAETYAGILTKEDTRQLFKMLTYKLKGNRSEATRRCGVTGKTTYNWKTAKYVKTGTKQRVLSACLDVDFLNTVDYLLRRSSDRTTDVLRTLLSTIFEQAMQADSKESFIAQLDRFEGVKQQHPGLISDRLEKEVLDMMEAIKERSSELSVPIPKRTVDEMTARELLDVIPLIGEMHATDPKEANTLLKTLDLPERFVEIIESTFDKIRPKKLLTKADKESDFQPIFAHLFGNQMSRNQSNLYEDILKLDECFTPKFSPENVAAYNHVDPSRIVALKPYFSSPDHTTDTKKIGRNVEWTYQKI